jgi:hypothetical protein
MGYDIDSFDDRRKYREQLRTVAEQEGGAPENYLKMANQLAVVGDIKGKNYYKDYAEQLAVKRSLSKLQQVESSNDPNAGNAFESIYKQEKGSLAKLEMPGAVDVLDKYYAGKKSQEEALRERKRKLYTETASTLAGSSWAGIKVYSESLKKNKGDRDTANKDLQDFWAKSVYHDLPEEQRALAPTPDKVDINTMYNLAGQSEKVMGGIIKEEGQANPKGANSGRVTSYMTEHGIDDPRDLTEDDWNKIERSHTKATERPKASKELGPKDYEQANKDIRAAMDKASAGRMPYEKGVKSDRLAAAKATKKALVASGYEESKLVIEDSGDEEGDVPQDVLSALKSGKAKKVKKGGVIWTLDSNGKPIKGE